MRHMGQRHFFHMLPPSPWPMMIAASVCGLALGLVLYMHAMFDGLFLFFLSLINVMNMFINWLIDVRVESTFQGMHTKKVQWGLRFGFALFMITEMMFFFAFFWSFFHLSLSPAVEVGCMWPPEGMVPITWYKLPLLNTLLLLLSGVYMTLVHEYLQLGRVGVVRLYFLCGLSCGGIFTLIQLYEYFCASFSMSDGVYGSTFFLLTGFHGVHVLVGTMFLAVCYYSVYYLYEFSCTHHVGFECAAWYWHFVDVVWLGLFLLVYMWGGLV